MPTATAPVFAPEQYGLHPKMTLGELTETLGIDVRKITAADLRGKFSKVDILNAFVEMRVARNGAEHSTSKRARRLQRQVATAVKAYQDSRS